MKQRSLRGLSNGNLILSLVPSPMVSGSGGCNTLTGSYELDSDKLTFSQMASTRMACPEGMDTEKAYLKASPRQRRGRLPDSSWSCLTLAVTFWPALMQVTRSEVSCASRPPTTVWYDVAGIAWLTAQ